MVLLINSHVKYVLVITMVYLVDGHVENGQDECVVVINMVHLSCQDEDVVVIRTRMLWLYT
jgi:hypothetical protein